MDIMRALERWTLDLRAARRSERTIDTYSLAVIQIADWAKQLGITEIEDVERDHIRRLIAFVMETRSAATAKQRHSSIHHFFSWLVAEGELESGAKRPAGVPTVHEGVHAPTILGEGSCGWLRPVGPP